MAELTVETGPSSGQILKFSAADVIFVGADAGCSLQVVAPGVADQHLVIKALKNGGFGIKMLDGPFTINGKPAEAARLRDGDVVEIANTRLRFGPKQTNSKAADLGTLGGYQLLEILGKGGHGTVYRAEQMSLRRHVALKILPKETTKNPEFVGRFVAEARAAARLSHPNVVQVFDVGHDGDTYYLSMEIMAKGSLEDRLRTEGKIATAECLPLIMDAARGLAYAESTRIVHRDIKPDNLMVDSHDTAKIADLGLALSDDEEQGKIVGTPHFMSPEQVLGKPLDHRSDLYSLGCTFFRLVTGRTLFKRSRTKEILRAHVKDTPESADEVASEVPANVAAIIDRMVEKAPDDRYQSAEELLEDLHRVLHPPAKRGMLFGTIAVLVLGLAFAIYYVAIKEPTIIKVPGDGDPQKTAALERQVRRSQAETERLRLMQNDARLDPMALAKRLDEFARKDKFASTPAATTAINKAKDLRTKETARRAAARAHAQAVGAAKTKLGQRLAPLLEAADFRAAWTALEPTDLPRAVLQDPAIVGLLEKLRGELLDAAAKRLDTLEKAVESAQTARDPDGALERLALVEAVLGKDQGWPRATIKDRPAVTAFIAKAKSDISSLRKELAAAAESAARAAYHEAILGSGEPSSGEPGSGEPGSDNVLALLRKFDFEAAAVRIQKLTTSLEGHEIGPTCASLLAIVQAATAYQSDFTAAVAAGKVTISVDVDGTMTNRIVRSFDPKSGLEVQAGDRRLTIAIAKLAPLRMSKIFQTTKADAPHAAGRAAFLGLHALAVHLPAARAYMGALDPALVESGTAANRYDQAMEDLNDAVRLAARIDAPWQKHLSREVRAGQSLAMGLWAFSRTQYTRAKSHLERLRNRFQTTLATATTTHR